VAKAESGEWIMADVCKEKFSQFDKHIDTGEKYRAQTRQIFWMVGIALLGIAYTIFSAQIDNARINGQITQIVNDLAETSKDQTRKIDALEKDVLRLSTRSM
jgi:hypothetical protein